MHSFRELTVQFVSEDLVCFLNNIFLVLLSIISKDFFYAIRIFFAAVIIQKESKQFSVNNYKYIYISHYYGNLFPLQNQKKVIFLVILTSYLTAATLFLTTTQLFITFISYHYECISLSSYFISHNSNFCNFISQCRVTM